MDSEPPLPPQSTPSVNSNSSIPVIPVSSLSTDSKKGAGKFVRIVLAFFIFVILITAGLSSAALAVAYEKLNLNNPELENTITNMVMNLPFTPKSPKYILQSAAISHARVSKHGFDISLSAKPEGGVSVLGFNQFDVSAVGQVDYSDSTDVKFQLKGSISKEFEGEIKKNARILYIKINKLPSLLVEMFKLKEDKLDALLENWIEYDTSPLDTEASRELDKATDQTSLTAEYVKNLISDLSHEKLLSNLILSEDILDGVSVYKLHLAADENTIDNFIRRIEERTTGSSIRELQVNQTGYKPSDYIKDLNLDLYIDRTSNHIKKVVTTFKYNPNYSAVQTPTQILGIATEEPDILGTESSIFTAGQYTYAVAAVIKFDNFGQDFLISTPANSIKIEEFYRKLFETSETFSQLGDPVELTKKSRDATRLTDLVFLQNAINVAIQESPDFGNSNKNNTILCNGESQRCGGLSIPSTGETRSSGGNGWVKINLSTQKYVSVPSLPVDPRNDDDFHYIYCAKDGNWEINAVLESTQYAPKMQLDGGNNDIAYEVGSDLTLIGTIPECSY